MSNDVYDGFKIVPKAFDSVESSQQKKVNIRLTQLKEKITIDHTNYIHDYHQTFDILFRASERIRHQQKFQFQEQAKMAQEAHEDELAEIKEDCNHEEDVNVPNTIQFVPKDMEISDTIEPYMRIALETGRPLIEVLPPTILAERLHYLSGSGTDTGSTSGYYSTSSASIGHSSATSDTVSNG